MEQSRQWYYRGSLKSCNYSCSYCPFSKKRSSSKMIEIDQKQFFRFVERLEQLETVKGAVQIVPYGEALIHSYYWEGLARLSNIPGMEAVGAQSNFSFPVEKMLAYYIQKGGQIDKLRLWGTFHPEMTTVNRFVNQCERLAEWKVLHCAGVVGNPLYMSDIQSLRNQLKTSTYLWINKMDGLRRNYTQEEIAQFQEIDEYFMLEMQHHIADENFCGNQIFVEADGSMCRCNLCRSGTINLYECMPGEVQLACSRKDCSCYLAYNNRKEMDLLFFQPYPAFRIPIYPKAVFLDVDGTLIPKGQMCIPKEICEKVKALAKHSTIYLATSLPLEEALRKVKEIRNVLAGGVFASGGRCVIFGKEENNILYDSVASIETEWLKNANLLQKKYGFRMHTYQKGEQVYKITCAFPKKKFKEMQETGTVVSELTFRLNIPQSCRWFIEDNCIEIVRSDRGKRKGILEIMREMGYQREEVMVAGDSAEDEEMLYYFPRSIRVSSKK